MRHARFIPSIADLVFIGVALLLAFGAAVALTQSDGDLFAHLRFGTTMLAEHRIPTASTFGVTTTGLAMTSPAWLSEVIFALAYRAGGLAFVAIIAALVIAAAHATVAALLRARGADIRWVIVGTLSSVALGASHWLARPHVFSLLAAAVLIAIMEQDDPRRSMAAVPFMAVWVNLHGAWTYGLVVMALYAVGDSWDWIGARHDSAARQRAMVRWGVLAAAATATLLNPYGLGLHRAVIASLLDPSVSGAIDEYRAPGFRQIGDLMFLVSVLLTVTILARARSTMRSAPLLVVLATMAAALMAGRNIALFAVTGWPLVALFASAQPEWRSRKKELRGLARIDSRAAQGRWSAAAAAALIVLGLNGGRVGTTSLVGAEVDAMRFPIGAIAALRAHPVGASDGERIFTPWDWGGYLVFVWPEQPAFIDPLRFSAAGVAAYGDILLTRPGWEAQLDRWRITSVLVPLHGRTAVALAGMPAWEPWYRDSTAVIYLRRAPHRM